MVNKVIETDMENYTEKTIVDIETALPQTYDKSTINNSYDFAKICVVGVFYENKIVQIPKLLNEPFDTFIYHIINTLDKLKQPFYAWNKQFDEDLLHQSVRMVIKNKKYGFEEISPYQKNNRNMSIISKKSAIESLGKTTNFKPIENNADYDFKIFSSRVPFEYFRYMYYGREKYMKKILDHNRTCLLSEAFLLKNKEKLK